MPMDHQVILPQLLRDRSVEFPDDVIVDAVGAGSMSYAELQASITQWRAAYSAAGVGPGDVVATMLPNSIRSFMVWMGAAWLRAIEMPVNTAYRRYMLRHILNDSQARLLVVDARYLPRLAEIAAELEFLERVVVVGGEENSEDAHVPFQTMSEADFIDPHAGASFSDWSGPAHYDTSCIIYTSGTTGPSKGVSMPWRELYTFPANLPEGTFEQGRGYYMPLPTFHLSGRQGIWGSALHRARLVIRDGFSVTAFWDEIRQYDCVGAALIGSMATLLSNASEGPVESPLRTVQMGPLIRELDAFREKFGVRVSSGYGMTEIGQVLATDGFNVVDPRSSGKPTPGYELRVADENDEPLGPGVIGELLVRSAEPWMLNSGYWRQPARTAEAWRNGWFHTGDAFSYDEDNNFYFADRIKDAIRRRGENISSFEIESCVCEHPAVGECAAVGVPSQFTEEDVKIWVVRKPGESVSASQLFEYLLNKMPQFMLPRYVEFIDSLPKTPTLRIRKHELRDLGHGPEHWDREADVSAPARA